jgi:tRNA-2-methylthio-N6-dimethylallyladenosine synthase
MDNPKKYHIITIGCQMNKSDSERIAGFLENNGWKEAGDIHQADYVILTTCGVRQSAEDRVYGLVPKIKRENPGANIILTGCLAGRMDVRRRLKDSINLWLPIVDLPGILKALGETESNEIENYLTIKPKYKSSFNAFVPIGNGCNNFCTYCVVPYARGREKYRPVREIIKEVQTLVSGGYKEIELIAQNVNSFRDGQTEFADLLKQTDSISGDFWIRFATSHPKDMSDKLIETIAGSRKICRHIHLPAQAGDNDVLKAMNRKYTREHYLELIQKIRKYIPGAAITTDIIVGFPGETEQQFQNTISLFEQAEFDMAYIARYSPRPGTAAEKLPDDVSPEEKKNREERLMDTLRHTALQNNQKYKGSSVKILIDGQDKKGNPIGKTDTYKNVKLINPGDSENITGQFKIVKIIHARDFGLEGKLQK